MAKNYLALARGYEDAIIAGELDACKWVRLACERNRRDRERQGTPGFPYVISESAATRICIAAESLPHIKGDLAKIVGFDDNNRPVWAKIKLEPWQCWFLTTLFGWVDAVSSLRRFRVGLLLVPRKNAKSTIAATIVEYMLTSDGESGPECYSAATTRDQAKVVAEIVWQMAKRSPDFCEYFGVRVGSETTYSLAVPTNAGKFSALSADAHTLDALNVSLAIVDELHAHKTRAVWDVLDTATGARKQPMILATSTAGVDIGGICYEQVGYLQRVLEGAIEDEKFFGIYYTIDEDDDWRTEAAMRKANPNYGISVDPEDLKRKAHAAEHSPSATNNYLTKHCNVWVRGEKTWMPMRQWISLGNRELKIEDYATVPCWIGVDLAEVRDIAALVAIFRPDRQHYVVFFRFYLPESAVEKSPIAQLPGWVNAGDIIETDGDQADFERIEDDIVKWCDDLNVQEICFDRALAAHMAQNLKRRLQPRMGKDAVEKYVVTVNQNVETMNPAMQLVESLTLSGHIAHDGNPAGNWQFSNVVVERNYKDEVYPRKAGGKDSPNKIDGPVSLFTGISRASQAVLAPPRKNRGVGRVFTPGGMVPILPEQAAPDGSGDVRA